MNTHLCTNRQAEFDQTDTGVMRIRAIFDNLGLVTEDVVFVSGDVDEVMSRSVVRTTLFPPLTSPHIYREAVRELAWCELTGEVAWGGLWMPMGLKSSILPLAFGTFCSKL